MNTDFGNSQTIPMDGDGGGKRRSVFRLVAGIAILALLAFGAYYFSVSLKEKIREKKIENAFADLGGQIYLTLASSAGDRGGGRQADSNEYVFDIESGSFQSLIPGDMVKITSAPSPLGDKIAYMATPYDAEAPEDYFYPATEFTQLYVYEKDSGEQRKITEQDTIAKRQPVWSPNGEKIAYHAAESFEAYDNPLFPLPPDNWEIHITDLEGNVEFIDKGAQSFWSSDGNQLLYVRNDGLHIYDTRTEQSRFAHDLGGIPVTYFMKFDLSDDGEFLAMSYPKGNVVSIYDVTSWEPFGLRLIENIPISGFSAAYFPRFSPDNRYVVFQWADFNPATETFFNFRLIAYDRESGIWKTILNLGAFRFDAAFTNDWTS